MKNIYILHQNGAPEHYKGLIHFCNKNGISIKFYEFSFLRQIASSIKHRNLQKLKKAFTNIWFLLSILIAKNYTIILGIAPYDYAMIFFSFISKKHNIYFHTSWPYWDKTRYDQREFISILGDKIFKSWSTFLEHRCKGIFCVSQYALDGLISAYDIKAPKQVVFHAFNSKIFFPDQKTHRDRPLKFLYVGRLVPNKGISYLLELLENLNTNEFELGIVGSGILEKDIKQSMLTYSNLTFYGKIDNNKLGDIYRQYDVFLLPSKKGLSGDWEELFGIALIEAMACGLIPISSDHIGPREILGHSQTGFLIRDSYLLPDLLTVINRLNHLQDCELRELSIHASFTSLKYQESDISLLWKNILIQQ